jgi:hypothetical protein
MARPQEISFIRHASNDRAALAVNILFFTKCALLVKAEGTETTELKVNLKIRRLSGQVNTNFFASRTELNSGSR